MDENRNARYYFTFDNGLSFSAHLTLREVATLVGHTRNEFGERVVDSSHKALKVFVEQGELIREESYTTHRRDGGIEVFMKLSNGFSFLAVLDEAEYQWLYKKALDSNDMHLTLKQLISSGNIVGEKDFRKEGGAT